MLATRMVGALLVLVGMVFFFLGGVALLVEADSAYTAIEAQSQGESRLMLPIGIVLTLAGGVVLVLSSARRFA